MWRSISSDQLLILGRLCPTDLAYQPMPNNPDILLTEILGLKEEIELVASRSLKCQPVFGRVTLPLPRTSHAELGFLRMVSWLYVHYQEAGKPSILFLCEKLNAYGLDPDRKHADHLRLVAKLRTFLQHNLDPTKDSDSATRQECECWLRRWCGSPVPGTDEHWSSCLCSLLSDARDFLRTITEAVRRIEKDESKNMIIEEWEIAVARHHPPHAFDVVIRKVAADIGRDQIDVPALRNRFYQQWSTELASLKWPYDFERAARQLVEHALLRSSVPILPVTGSDIMTEFGIAPGRRVGEILTLAHRLYDSAPCDRQELLCKIKSAMESTDMSAG